MADADNVQRLAGDFAIADTTLNIPHPYEDGLAEKWISNHRDWFLDGEQVIFAITLKEPAGTLIGAVGLQINPLDDRGELGYWLGKDFWNRGYCTEAARAVVEYGFEQMRLHRIQACHFTRNPASGRVLEKIGMVREGLLRGHSKRWEAFEDIVIYGLVNPDGRAATRPSA